MPRLEKKVCLRGFQNPLTPSYFSNSHQSVGLVSTPVRKHAVIGSPISSIEFLLYDSKNLPGISCGIGAVEADIPSNKSGRARLIVARRLHRKYIQYYMCCAMLLCCVLLWCFVVL